MVPTRSLRAQPERVLAGWLDAEAMRDWFSPDTFEGVSAEAELRVGGRWRVESVSATGERLVERGEFREIVPSRRLVLTLAQTMGTVMPNALPGTTITVAFGEDGEGGTLMALHQTGFEEVASRDGVAEGRVGCLGKLAARLGSTEEPRPRTTPPRRRSARS